MTTAGTVLALVAMVTELAVVMEKLALLGNKIKAGEPVTQEDLDAARAGTTAAVARWNAAAPSDRQESNNG